MTASSLRLRNLALALGLASLPLLASTAGATGTSYQTCNGVLGPVIVSKSVRVPPNGLCVMTGTRVKGDVLVETGGQLEMTAATIDKSISLRQGSTLAAIDSRVKGNIESNGHLSVQLDNVVVQPDPHKDGGNVRLYYGQAGSLIFISASTVAGDLELAANTGDDEFVYDSMVNDDLVVYYNNSPSGFQDLTGNDVQGDVYYALNRSLSTFLDSNTVGGYVTFAANQAENSFSVADNTVDRSIEFSLNHGFSDIAVNIIGRDLNCYYNDPAPAAAGNVVAGSTRGQCVQAPAP